MEQNIGNNILKTNIETTTKLRTTVKNFLKQPRDIKVPGPDFYLALNYICSILLKKSANYLYFYVCNKSDSEIKIQRTIVLLDCHDVVLHQEKDKNVFVLNKGEDVDMLTSSGPAFKNALTKDTLIIDLCINIQEIEGERIHQPSCYINPEKKLREDLKAMLENPVNADVSLKVNDEVFPVHWSVLCSRSPYFKKMFESKMSERIQNSIIITDSSFGTIKKLVEFLYTANIVPNDDLQELFDLYYAADKYEVIDLRSICACNIMKAATVNNICEILLFAHRHSDKYLKMQAMDFLQLQPDSVFQSNGWKTFETSEPLAAEIFTFCLNKR